MRRLLPLIALAFAFTAQAQRIVCFSRDGVFRPPAGCAALDRNIPVRPAAEDRKFAIFNQDSFAVMIGIQPAGESSLDASPRPMIALNYWLDGDSDGTAVVTSEQLGTWKLTLDSFWFKEGRLNLQVPHGAWRWVVTRDGKVLTDQAHTFTPPSRPSEPEKGPPRMLFTGRATASDGRTGADFAEITADCNRVICIAAADGAFRCNTHVPRGGALCIEHPVHGRKRIELEGRSGTFALGLVQLVSGAMLRVVKPLHVELPEKTTISLLHRGSEIEKPQELGSREVLEFPGLKPGQHAVLLAGTEPLQRKLFPVEVREGAPAEVILSLEPYRLTGEIELRKKPLEAKVRLEGEAWSAAFDTDQSGRFDAELWSPGDYGVGVEAPSLAQPYLVMKRVSPSDSHWRLVVPSRRIYGRVFDAESGKPVPQVSLQVEADDGSTRAQRVLDVREDGSFEYPGAAEGQYAFTATAAEYLGSEKVHVAVREADGDLRVDLPLLRGVAVRVTVVDSQGNPIVNAIVLSEFAPNGMPARVARTDAAGVVTVTVAEKGEKMIYVVPQSSFAVARITARHAENGARVIVPDGVSTLRLRARSTEDQPLSGISFALRHAGEAVPQGVLARMAQQRNITLATDAGGELAIAALPAGEYQLAWRQRGAPQAAGWTKVTLTPGETKLTHTFATAKAGK